MGLIGDRKSKKAKEKEKEIERLKNGQNVLNKTKSPLKKGVMGGGGGVMVGRYPAGYYTTPNPQSSSWAREGHHPSQPRHQPHLNPRYQTWVAPRKQQSLSSLVSGLACTLGANFLQNSALVDIAVAKFLGQISQKLLHCTAKETNGFTIIPIFWVEGNGRLYMCK